MDYKYEEYYLRWLSSMEEKIEYWKLFMEEKVALSFHGFEKTISACRPFELEDDVPLRNCFVNMRILK